MVMVHGEVVQFHVILMPSDGPGHASCAQEYSQNTPELSGTSTMVCATPHAHVQVMQTRARRCLCQRT
jgi:hypothetical protein